ncbi:acid protease [Schizopora paradoxa]|uniref:Acid protease n=1 Tax=Schizopora paradoxa TaxID=27342 RepID=A0A0H2RKU6_9AGAM|nr:acid protease [Schizopora paradoxa]
MACSIILWIATLPITGFAHLNSETSLDRWHAPGAHKVSLRSTRQEPMPMQGPALPYPLFSPMFAQRERQNVKVKYEDANDTIAGIGISPPLNIDFVNKFPKFTDPSTVFTYPNTPMDSNSGPPLVSPAIVPLGKLPLTDFISNRKDILYYGPLDFGTPAQQLTVDIDTGSADLWVASDCDECSTKQFRTDQSQTINHDDEDFSVAYGSGEVFGTIAEDVVSVAGLTSEQQTIGLVEMESSDFQGYPNSGILGLAFSTISSTGKPTLFENLMKENKLMAPFFSVHLTRGTEDGSELCLGCFDVTKTTGQVKWVPVSSKTYWAVNITRLYSDGIDISVPDDFVAAIDTGTTLIYVPDPIAQTIYSSIAGAKSIDRFGPGFFSYPCTSSPDIRFTFGGIEFEMNDEDFNIGRLPDSSDCIGGIVSLGSDFPSNIAIIGDEFLKSWYTVYDYSNGARVGFAPSINNM